MDGEPIVVRPEVFDENYKPPVLRVRGDMARLLLNMYIRRIEHRPSTTDIVFIYSPLGRVGVGKTLLARWVGEAAEQVLSRRGLNFRFVYINVYERPTIHEVVNKIADRLGLKIAKRGPSLYEKVKAIADRLYMENMRILVALDEVQVLLQRDEDAAKLYSIVRLYEEVPERVAPGVGADFLFIAQSETALSQLKERLPQVHSMISFKLALQPYKTGELYEILRQRAELGLRPGSWSDEVLYTIAEFYGIDSLAAGDPSGSARSAIKTLYSAALAAEAEGAPAVFERHVRFALSSGEARAVVDRTALRGLSKHKKLLLLAIAQLALAGRSPATTGEVRREYEAVAEQYGEEPRGKTQFNEYLQELERLGLIIRRPSGKGMRGRTTLISLSTEIRPDVLRSELVRMLEGRPAWI